MSGAVPAPTRRKRRAATERRRFIVTASAAAAFPALGFPRIVKAQVARTMRFQGAWSPNDPFHEYALDFAKRVNDLAGGELAIQMLPAGAIVTPAALFDAVSKGTLDGAHTALVNDYARNPALALWGAGPAFGMDANMLLAWHRLGGGKALLARIYDAAGGNVQAFLYGPMFTQPLGWYQRPIGKVADFKGLRFRTIGLAEEVFAEMGAVVKALPADEIVPAFRDGQLDGAAFNNLSSDRGLGLPEVTKLCMLQSFHRNAEQFEILFNRSRYERLPAPLRTVVENAVDAASAELSWKAIDRLSRDYVDLQVGVKVKFYKTPDAILEKQLDLYDQVVMKQAAGNPLFKAVVDSQRAFAARVVRWDMDNNVNRRMAFNHYFLPKAAPTGRS